MLLIFVRIDWINWDNVRLPKGHFIGIDVWKPQLAGRIPHFMYLLIIQYYASSSIQFNN
jgi:hypothetical protein